MILENALKIGLAPDPGFGAWNQAQRQPLAPGASVGAWRQLARVGASSVFRAPILCFVYFIFLADFLYKYRIKNSVFRNHLQSVLISILLIIQFFLLTLLLHTKFRIHKIWKHLAIFEVAFALDVKGLIYEGLVPNLSFNYLI